MSRRSTLRHVFAAVTAVAVLSACEDSPLLDPTDDPLLKRTATPDSSNEEWIQAVRQATARFHSTEQAEMAGYEEDEFCVAIPGVGGMGHHWLNLELVDPVFDPLQPEVLLYAPGPNGKPRLVAVEYIVIDAGQQRPSFGDQLLDVGGTPIPVTHWSLHVWLYESNPSGRFAAFNPNVGCP